MPVFQLLMRLCAVIPTYNNAATLGSVLDGVLAVCPDVIVVNDGSSDATGELLANAAGVHVIGYYKNRGKGNALRVGLREARRMGFDYVVTLDSDGQHSPSDIPALVDVLTNQDEQFPTKSVGGYKNSLVVGSRNLSAEGMPHANTFANRFSNFWFTVQTGLRLPDTQTGFRIYPLHALPPLWLLPNRYEAELLLLVLMAWKGVHIVPAPVSVAYPDDRVSHFRPFRDFARISLLNTLLCIVALIYGWPRTIIRRLFRR